MKKFLHIISHQGIQTTMRYHTTHPTEWVILKTHSIFIVVKAPRTFTHYWWEYKMV